LKVLGNSLLSAERILIPVVASLLSITGCVTSQRDYSAYTDDQLIAEHDKMSQRIVSAEAQVQYLLTQAGLCRNTGTVCREQSICRIRRGATQPTSSESRQCH